MASFEPARRSNRRNKSSNSSTFVPAEGVKITPALKKLLSEDGWQLKGSGSKKQEAIFSPPKMNSESKGESSSSSSDEEEEQEAYYLEKPSL